MSSLNLEEECVDPLEFLEVDQDSISESIESDEPSEAAIVEDTQLSHDGSHKDNVVHLSDENTQQTDKLQLLNDENKQAKLIHNSDGSSQQNHQSFNTNSMEKDMIKQDIIYDVIEECLPGKPPVATMCKISKLGSEVVRAVVVQRSGEVDGESSGGSTVIIPLEGALFRLRRHEVANIGSAGRPPRILNTIPNQH
ncbi:hypothetical protein J6590_042569 [Homalodisca vitripennis]|nr:hypothetical protein J6590_042569 [Homalodisca vitripennis]